MKKSFLVFFLILLSGWARAAFDDGDGTSSDPYLVSTAAQLNDVRNYLSSYFIQTADIDLSAYSTDPGWVPIGDATTKFTGSYDGGGHKIKKLYINRTGVQYQGLFGYTSSATIKNLGVEANIYSNTTNVGGLAGYAKATNISKCYTKGSIIGYNYTAGLIGQTTATPGLTQGLNGPVVAFMTITDCYSLASVSGNYYVGGLIGDASGNTFTNCYATGDVYSSQTSTKGGLVGRSLSTGTVTSCFWDTETSGLSVSAIGTGKTTAEMKTQSTFTNWNFTISPIIWDIDSDNNGYPHLNWQVFTHNKYYVKQSGNDVNAGTSWGAAFLTFQKALVTATSGDQIWVAAGTYKPSVQVGGTGARYVAFQMIDEVDIYGGFSGSESSVSERANFGVGLANETILSGDLSGNDNYSVTPWTGTGENCYRVIYDKNLLTRLTPSAILDGFTIKGAFGNQYGGGMIVEDCSPTLRNLIFINNHCYAGGGGIYTWRGTTKCSPVLINCLFVNNLSNNGAGVWNRASSPVFSNVTIAYNTASTDGGGMWNGMGAAPVLNNCLIWGNTGGSSSTGKQFYADGTITLNYSCYSNVANDNYGTMAASSCITIDPQFADAVAKDYRIAGNSPCADAGNDVYNILATDIRGSGFGRKLLKTNANSTGAIDMGAYEYKFGIDPPIPCINPTSGGTIAENQTGSNPFDPATFTSTAAPTGFSGTLEYKWQVSTTNSSAGFSDIASSNAETYNAGPISQTTWYKRIAHVSCKADWTGAVESNVLTMTVMPILTWNGSVSTNWNTAANWNLSSVPSSLNNVIIPDVTNDPIVNQLPGSPSVCNNLTIESGAVLTLASGKALTVNGIVTNNAGIPGLVIESGASMIQNDANVLATVKRDITAGGSLWHLFISPVTQSINASASSCFEGAYLDRYNEPIGAWVRLVTDEDVVPDYGYSVKFTTGIHSLIFPGTLKASPVAYSDLSYSAAAPGYSDGWNLAGNPYTCGINPALCTLSGGLNAFAYVWNGSNYNTLSIGNSVFSGTIAPLQGFFVRTSSGINSLTLNNAAKTHAGSFLKNAAMVQDMLKLTVNGNGFSDETYVRFCENATSGFDQEFDAYKLFGLDAAPQLYSMLAEDNATVNTLPAIEINTDIAIGFKAGAESIYTITATGIRSFDARTALLLDDMKTNTTYNLRMNPIFSFAASPGDMEHRFTMHFKSSNGIAETTAGMISIYSNQHKVYVSHPYNLQGSIHLYDITGRLLSSTKMTGNSTDKIDIAGYSGSLLVKVITEKGITTGKVFVN